MIYCVVPQALAGELLEALEAYYADEPNVKVIVDRRSHGGAPGSHDAHANRRRVRPKGSFPPIEAPRA